MDFLSSIADMVSTQYLFRNGAKTKKGNAYAAESKCVVSMFAQHYGLVDVSAENLIVDCIGDGVGFGVKTTTKCSSFEKVAEVRECVVHNRSDDAQELVRNIAKIVNERMDKVRDFYGVTKYKYVVVFVDQIQKQVFVREFPMCYIGSNVVVSNYNKKTGGFEFLDNDNGIHYKWHRSKSTLFSRFYREGDSDGCSIPDLPFFERQIATLRLEQPDVFNRYFGMLYQNSSGRSPANKPAQFLRDRRAKERPLIPEMCND
jgi:hypothetical protein